MAAFDITTKPTSLSLKPGTTGTIMVVVSNRLGRPVMGLVEGTMTPASAARWLVPPPDLQRRYEADPAATVNYEFKINVPKDTPSQAAQFKASVRDVMSPDDTRVEGQTVGINVTAADAPEKKKRVVLPWWVWLVAGVVVLGVGIGIYLLVRPKGVPNVVGMTRESATAKLTAAGFAPVAIKDTVVKEAEDSNRVVRQEPKARSPLPVDSMKGKTKATIVVLRKGRTTARGDGRLELAVWRPGAEGRFHFIPSATGIESSTPLGTTGDIPVVRDYDGDSLADLAVWHPSDGMWSIIRSSDGSQVKKQWGSVGDKPVPADYDGDGKADLAVWNVSSGVWRVMRSADSTPTNKQWGYGWIDVPVPGDYDGDGRTDFAVWRRPYTGPTGTWLIVRSGDNTPDSTAQGTYADVPVQADYDGDKRTDMALWRPSTGNWQVLRSTDAKTTTKAWGELGDLPAPGDYDGDGKADFAYWRPSSGTWWISKSAGGPQITKKLGQTGDSLSPGDFDSPPE